MMAFTMREIIHNLFKRLNLDSQEVHSLAIFILLSLQGFVFLFKVVNMLFKLLANSFMLHCVHL